MRAMDIETDRKLIAELGGPSRVASMLGIDDKGTQRVHNWMRRGIPAAVRVEHPHLFMPNMAQALANTAQTATETVAPTV